jgi:Carboxypeptidase regulatory-like domain/TonB dependent receptor/TonB-dependent Receptor Plug Domain
MMTRNESGRSFLGRTLAAVLTLGLLASISAFAQVVGGSLSGTVTDASGAALSGATVSIKNVATGVVTTVTTNTQGIFSAPNLLPGNYQATISALGFQTSIQNDIVLTVGSQQVLNLAIKVGTVSERVEVSTLAPDVQLMSSTISNDVDSTTVRELPLNGRSWTDLATLQPGVSVIRAMVSVTSTDRLGRGLGVELSVTGGRPQQNNYLMNGVSMNDYSNQAPGSILGGNLGVDAVAEFNVLTTNYSTEYGRTSGGVISAITRSGTNQFHGSAFEYLRNSALDARNFFDFPAGPGLPTKPAFRRNQFGASAGGPIRKDKTFIFGAYEGLRENLGLSEFNQVPSLNARQGILCDFQNSVDCSQTTNNGVNALVLPYLQFFPKPNGAIECVGTNGLPCVPGAGDIADFSFGGARITHENYFITRLDDRISDRDNLAGSYMFDNAPSSQNDEFNNKIVFFKTRRQLVTLEENHIFSPFLANSLRAGFNRVLAAAPAGGTAVNPLAADTSLGFAPGETAGSINIGGLTGFTGSLSTTQPQVFHWNSWQVYDNLFLVKGIHSLKFGANFERIQDNSFSSSFPGGVFNFASAAAFITNDSTQPISLSIDVPGHVTPRGIRETLFGAYVQDDVRYRPNLSFNVGLRYEMATVPTEVHGQLATLHHLTDAAPVLGSPLFANPSLRDFEPRVGFSWDPFRNGKTAVRGGFGMFDVQVLPLTLRHTIDGTVPFALSGNGSNLAATTVDPNFFPKGAFQAFTAPTDNTSERVAFIEQNPPRNYVMQWNLNVQREIAPSTTAMIAYVGSRTVHNIFQGDDASIVLPLSKTQFGYLWPIPTQPLLPVLNPNFGRISVTLWNSNAVYHALEVQVKKRLSHGFQAQASYTFGKSIDTSSGSTDGDQFQNGISTLFFFDQKVRRGPSDFNVTHTLTVSYTWEVPSPKNLTGVLGWTAKGWEFGGILQANGGVPFTPIIGPDPLGLNNTDPFDFPNYVPGCNPIHGGNNYLNLNCFTLPVQPAALAGQCQTFGFRPPNPPTDPGSPGIAGTCANLLGNAGRNSLVGPGLVNFDLSLFKNNPVKRISETFNVQFRMEIFNSLNHANFNPPTSNNQIFDGTGTLIGTAGTITSTATTSRQIQFALKFIW